jgi:predicted nucleotidyltransferase
MGIDGPIVPAAARYLIQAHALFPLENPGIVGIPVGLLGTYMGTFLGTMMSRVENRYNWFGQRGSVAREGCVMNREEIIARLRENEATLRKRGVAHAALFGSRARGDHRAESDADIMIEFDPAARITIFDYANLKDYIAELFDGRVDVVNRSGLKPYFKPAATVDAIYAF